LAIIDVSNPTAPGAPAYLDNVGNAFAVSVVGSYAYVASGLAGLAIIDISDPTSASVLGVEPTDDSAVDVAIHGIHA
jgi:hypothetical protein